MTRRGNLYGPDATFLGVPAADPDDPATWGSARAALLGAPFDGGTSHRPGARFGPQAIRLTDYLPHDGRRPSLALGVDPLEALAVVDLGDVEMPSGETERSLAALEGAVAAIARAGVVPVILGGDHTIALPDVTGVARHWGWGRVAVVHFDAHADTGETQMGSLYGHGTPMRRLIESGACRGDRFIQIGLRGYWPEPETLAWMAQQSMRSFEMSEVVARGLDAVLDEALAIATDDCDAVFLSVDVDVVDPGHAPGTGTPEPGGLSSRQLLDAVRRIAMEVPLAGMDVVEVAPPYDHAEVTAYLANRVVLEALSGLAWRLEGGRTPARPLLEGR
ncbi:MAG TPA: agmatinase [Acidimicrobiales bacterium]|nr:agmatinase [Acidimicrobiales bacterium]